MEWLGYILLHEQELKRIDAIKENIIAEHGNLTFELKSSSSSGELFHKFYELHMWK